MRALKALGLFAHSSMSWKVPLSYEPQALFEGWSQKVKFYTSSYVSEKSISVRKNLFLNWQHSDAHLRVIIFGFRTFFIR